MTSSFPTLGVFVQALAASFWEALTKQHYPWDLAGGKQSLEVAQLRVIKAHVVDAMRGLMAAGRRGMQERERLPMNRQLDLAYLDPLARATDWRQRLAGRELSSVVAALREDRGR